MFIYLLKRLFMLVPVLFCVVTAVFFMLRLIPGDPVDLILGENALPAAREKIVDQFHFDEPLSDQYQEYLSGIFKGNWGQSYFYTENTQSLLIKRFKATVFLSLCAIVMALMISIPLGTLSALFVGKKTDKAILLFSLAGISVPSFYLGPLLVLLFSIHLDWFPAQGQDLQGAFILPSLSMGLALSGSLVRITRSSLLEVLDKDYIRTARAKGLKKSVVILRHAFRTGFIPVVSILGLQFGTLLAGAVVTEKIFAWPGLGSLMMESIMKRDYALVQSSILIIATSYVCINLATDLLQVWLDPRIRDSFQEESI